MTKERWIVREGIAGIASMNEVVIVDPAHLGILITRWVDWSEYPRLMDHRASLCPLDGPPPSPRSPRTYRLRLMD